MNKKQLTEFGRMQFYLLELAANVDAASAPRLIDALESIRAIVESLPAPGNLMREQQWRSVERFVINALEPYSQAYGDALVNTMVDAIPEMQKHAVVMAERAGLAQVSLAAPGNQRGDVRQDPDQQRHLDRTAGCGPGFSTSPLTLQNARKVNTTVVRGILEDLPTHEIAKQIVQTVDMPGLTFINTRGSTVARNIKATGETIARTAIQDLNMQITEATWDANQEAIEEAGLEYEWVSALDSRLCPACAPWDGAVGETEAALIKKVGGAPPLHPNCRCMIVLRDPDDDDFNDAPRTGQQLFEEQQPGGYKTKVKVKGEKFYRKAEEVTSGTRAADYIAESNELTQREFFGGGPKYVTRNGKQEYSAAESRATWFRSEVSKGKDPQSVLAQMTSGKGGASRFLSPANLPR